MSNNEYPKFTVIIPQKDRAEYLIHTLRTCMIQDYPNFEVIVGDDCSEDNSVEVVRELQKKDSRIKLLAHDHHVGMRDNFELALAEVKEGYVMALGGDDGLTPGCVWRMYNIIKETGAKLLTWKPAGFNYPMEEARINKFSIRKKSFDGVKMIKSTDFLNTIAKTFRYLIDECPMFYIKGVASMELVNRVRSRTPDGCFYYCPTPDGFSGVVLAGEVEEYAYTSEPLSINGGSPKSQGRNYKRIDEKSKKESQQFFNDNIRRTMHRDLACQQYSPLVTLMTADYLLTARDLPGWPGEFQMFSYKDLIKKTFSFLVTSTFENEVLVREMKILREIAIQHGELELFNTLLKTKKRKVVREDIQDGFIATSNSFIFDSTKMGIYNIFDAAMAVKFAYNLCNSIDFSGAKNLMKRYIKVALNSRNYKTEHFPRID